MIHNPANVPLRRSTLRDVLDDDIFEAVARLVAAGEYLDQIPGKDDLADGQIWGCDPNPSPSGVACAFPQGMTIAEWFTKWLENRLFQPCYWPPLSPG